MSGQRRNKTTAACLLSNPSILYWNELSLGILQEFVVIYYKRGIGFTFQQFHCEIWVPRLNHTDICISSTPTCRNPSHDVVASYHA